MARTRLLAWLALAGQLIFIAAWLVAGALQTGYSHIEHFVSELGADGAEHAWIANGGIVVLGLSFVALALALRPVLPRRRASDVAAGAMALHGLGFVAAALLPIDCLRATDALCQAHWDGGDVSAAHVAHIWVALVTQAASVVVAFALARALWPRPAAVLALVSGLIGLGIGIVLAVVDAEGAQGLWQRWSLAAMHLGALLVVAGVLWAARREPQPPPPAPMRPRDFFGRSWAGEGEVVLRPEWLGRLMPLRFRATRAARWLSDEAWVYEDTAAFGNGYTEHWRVFCEFVTPERVEIIGGHLPDGTGLRFEPEGYRIRPYRLAVPLGPVVVALSCWDRHALDPDGTLHDTIDMSIGGLRVARTTIRLRPVGDAVG